MKIKIVAKHRVISRCC